MEFPFSAASASALLLAGVPFGLSNNRKHAADLCQAMPGTAVDSILSKNAIPVTITSSSGTAGSCTYQFSDASVSLMIDMAEAGSSAEAAAALGSLRKALPSARTLAGIGDQAFIYDEGVYGVITVKYRLGARYGQVNLRATQPGREPAVIALAHAWTERGIPAARTLASAEVRPAAPVRPAPTAKSAPRPAAPPAAVEPDTGEPVAQADSRPLPPLPPLHWPDPDSTARARGLTRSAAPPRALPKGVPTTVAALRLLSPLVGADTLFTAGARAVLESQAVSLAKWHDDEARTLRDSLAHARAERYKDVPQAPPPGTSRRPGPNAPAEPAGDIVPVARSGRRLMPQWYHRTKSASPDPVTRDGAVATAEESSTFFKEPWEMGEELTEKTVVTQKQGDAAFSQRLHKGRTISLGICPDADGLVKGHGTSESDMEVRLQTGAKLQVLRIGAKGTFEIVARVNDEAAIQSYDVFVRVDVEHSQTSTGGDLPQNTHTIVQVATTEIDPGINWKGPNVHDEGWDALWAPKGGESYSAGGNTLPETDATFAAIVLGEATGMAQEYLQDAMGGWWFGDCEEIRVVEAPRKTHLRAGEPSQFKLGVYHYQDRARAALPIEAFSVGQTEGDAGQISPEKSGDSPALFTFTAPSKQKARGWKSSHVFARSVSRRGRSSPFSNPPVFTKLDESALYLVEAHMTLKSRLDGVVFDVKYEGYVGSDKDDPQVLRFTSGTYTGFVRDVVRIFSNCKVVKDENRPVQGAVDTAASGAGFLPPMSPGSKESSFLFTINPADFDRGQTLGTVTNMPGTPLDRKGNGQTRRITSSETRGCEEKGLDTLTSTVEANVIRIGL